MLARLAFSAQSIHESEADASPANTVPMSTVHGDRSSSNNLAHMQSLVGTNSAKGQNRRSYKVKLKTWTAGLAALVLSSAPVFAVEGTRISDSFLTPASCDDCCDPGCCDPVGCGCGVGAGGLFSGIGGGYVEGFSLASALGLQNSWLEIGGFTQMGYHDQIEPISPQAGPPVTPVRTRGDGLSFLDTPGDFLLNQQWFFIGKTADGSNGLDFGFRADAVYGTQARQTQSFGNPGAQWDNAAAFDHGVYGWAIPQLYAEIAVGDFAAKVGHFFTPLGYEVIPATGNFFYSHALTMFNSEPFTHSGVLTTYTGFEGITLYTGWSAGWDTGFTNANSGSNLISGFSAELLDSVTFTYLNTYGNFGRRSVNQNLALPNSDDDYSHSIVINAGLTDKLSYIFQTDYLRIDNEAAGYEEEDLGINQYLIYQYNDIVGLGTRMEWWKNDGVSNYALTSGVNVKLLGNLIMRPELRKDWVPATGFDEDMVGCDMILTY